MTTELFQADTTLSPRLSWLRKHDLCVTEYQHPHSLNGNARWVCSNRAQTRYACADTEDAAEQRYCERYDLPWWKLADWNGAMETTPWEF